MNKQITFATRLALAGMLLVFFSGCFKDNCTHTYTLYMPVYKSLTEARKNMKSNAPIALQKTGKIYIYGNYIFLNEPDMGIHVIDNSQPSNPKNIAFINIPGNVDLAVKGNTLYADSYNDLVAFDISNPRQVVAKNFLNNVFPENRRFYHYAYGVTSNPDSVFVAVEWIEKDTTVDCETYQYLYNNFYASASADSKGYYSAPPSGMGGSMARFTLVNDFLYTVSTSNLSTFNLYYPPHPILEGTKNIGWGIETIYPFKDNLFIGSTTGMFIFSLSNPSDPMQVGNFSHATSCDPVIADDKFAYVTLRTGTNCRGVSNLLDVINIDNINAPSLVKTYPLTNPHGLSKDENLLFICDGDDGLKVFDASNPFDLKVLKKISGMKPFDVIAWNKRALVVAEDGLYQFDYSNVNDIRLLSKISLNKKS